MREVRVQIFNNEASFYARSGNPFENVDMLIVTSALEAESDLYSVQESLT